MTLVETIKYTENLAELLENQAQVYEKQGNPMSYLPYKETAKEYKQRAEWLKELKERREIQDILLQFLVDSESDICCADSADDEKECEICADNCNNITKDCWIRWAKMKAREVNANDTNRCEN